MRLRPITAAAVLLSMPLFTVPAYVAGEGGTQTNTQKCKRGEVWNQRTQKCEVPKQGMIDDESLYEAGRDLAMAGRYDEAIEVLSLAADKRDPRILNYLGYSHRKQGRILVGLGYYEEAVRADPKYTLVREYLGEAHLQLGDVGKAKLQLAAIEKLCGRGCEEYRELAEQIEAFKAKGG